MVTCLFLLFGYDLVKFCWLFLSLSSDGETFISADDLRINLWNLEISNQSFNIVDVKPANMEDLTGKIITNYLLIFSYTPCVFCVSFPRHFNIFAKLTYQKKKKDIQLCAKIFAFEFISSYHMSVCSCRGYVLHVWLMCWPHWEWCGAGFWWQLRALLNILPGSFYAAKIWQILVFIIWVTVK